MNPPLIPGKSLSIDRRKKFWRVVQNLARTGRVEPRDFHPDLYPLSSYKVAEELGWAESDPNATYLTYTLTPKGKAEFLAAFNVGESDEPRTVD